MQEYWNSKGLSNIKIPQIGGFELDFYRLYKAVIKRGGAQQVSNNKLWKEIVNEFGLPPTCTSASFTLRNHYTKFLLGYEQKYFFGRDDDSDLPELMAGRIRKLPRREKSENMGSDEEEDPSSSEMSEDNRVKPQQQPINKINPINSQLGQQLGALYQKQDKKDEIYYIKKTKMFHQKGDLKRIQLAFQSRLHDEMTFALNSLLLYSVNTVDAFILDHGSQLLENITNYLEEAVKNIPSLYKAFHIKQIVTRYQQETPDNLYNNQTEELIKTLNILENYNYSVGQIILMQQRKNIEISPIDLLKKRQKEYIKNVYEVIGEVHLLEQVRTIFTILRNLCYHRSNELAIAKDERLCQLIIQLFLLNCDQEISRNLLDIISNISKHIQLCLIPDYLIFCDRIFEILNNDQTDELESAIDTLRNLMTIPENESILEKQLNKYITSITRLLLYSHGDIREGLLEFLCFLSDLKMSTKVQLAKEPKLLMRLIGLLSSGVGKSNEKITKLAALTLNNIAMAPASRMYMLPFEKDLFIVASSDESVSKLLGDILGELDTYEIETNNI